MGPLVIAFPIASSHSGGYYLIIIVSPSLPSFSCGPSNICCAEAVQSAFSPFRRNCPICKYIFGVLVGGDEFSVFYGTILAIVFILLSQIIALNLIKDLGHMKLKSYTVH